MKTKYTWLFFLLWSLTAVAKTTLLLKILQFIPAADVRPVVLCRDCKHNMANIPDIHDGININENWNACQLTELYDSVKPDDFCSHGKRKEKQTCNSRHL